MNVRHIYSGIQKALSRSSPSLLIDSSTISPHVSRELAVRLSPLGALVVDAPVSGGVGGAQNATLTFMVGASDEGFSRARPILEKMGKNIVHCGNNGTGQIAKVCNNVVLGMEMVAVSEGMSLGVKLGMDPSKLAAIFNSSSARSWSSDTYNPCPGVMPNVPSSRGYEGGFGTALMHKDMGLAIDAAKEAKHYMPLATLTETIYKEIMQQGNGNKDFSFVYEYLKNKKV